MESSRDTARHLLGIWRCCLPCLEGCQSSQAPSSWKAVKHTEIRSWSKVQVTPRLKEQVLEPGGCQPRKGRLAGSLRLHSTCSWIHTYTELRQDSQQVNNMSASAETSYGLWQAARLHRTSEDASVEFQATCSLSSFHVTQKNLFGNFDGF